MNKIIIPTDFSEGAWHATEYGLRLAKALKVNVLLIHAYHEPQSGASNLVSIVDLMKKDAEVAMAEQSSKIDRLKLGEGINIELLPVYGELMDVLSNYISDGGNQLIVMGTQGATGLRGVVFGTNTSDAINKIDAPLLSVPPDVEYGFENGISCGIDENLRVHPEDFDWLKGIVKLSHSKKIDLVNVLTEVDTDDLDITTIPEQFKELDYDFKEVLNENVIDGLDAYIKESQTDCMVIIKRNLNFFQKLLKRSTSKNLVTISKCPLLIIRSKN